LTGSQLNYAWVLIDRAENACGGADDAVAMVNIREFEALLHPISGAAAPGAASALNR